MATYACCATDSELSLSTHFFSDEMDKQLYCIRHGESQFNEWRTRSLLTFSWIFTRDPMILDPRLSAKGEQQVTGLYERLRADDVHTKVQAIVVSPLTRAIQTASGGFRDVNVPYVVDASCREMLDTSSDIGRDAADIANDFSHLNLDLSALEPHWWVSEPLRTDASVVKVPTAYEEVVKLRETKEQVDQRIQAFLTNAAKLPYDHIAIVGHSYFFKRMLGMNRKLANCELAVVSLRDLAQRHNVTLDG